MSKFCVHGIVVASLLALSGCAKKTETQDPYESFNRQVFAFNTTVDKAVLKPVAEGYQFVTPTFVRTGVTNFFNNLSVPATFVNDILQGKARFAIVDVTRLIVNTTVGVGGLFDVATHMGITHHRNDFGKTFAYWTGDDRSDYLMLPFLGPSTFRDTAAIPFTVLSNPLFYVNNDAINYGGTALDFVNFRANLLPSDPLVYNAFDPYAAMRDAYLQTRNKAILHNNDEGDYHPGMAVKHEAFDSPYKQTQQAPKVEEEDFTFN